METTSQLHRRSSGSAVSEVRDIRADWRDSSRYMPREYEKEEAEELVGFA
ncbi:MAG: hypothetical protein QXO16_04670 [Archaeoglobaceae archaeon]